MNSAIFKEANESAQMTTQNWIEWKHEMRGFAHCDTCIALDKRWFTHDNRPTSPLHPNCHCSAIPIPTSMVMKEAVAASAFSKFNPYLFDPMNLYQHGKNHAFESWGYSVSDSEWLQNEYIRQARTQYLSGNYKLGKLNERGQRITIRITIPRKNGVGNISFDTGWMVHPNGKIQLTTPYGGK